MRPPEADRIVARLPDLANADAGLVRRGQRLTTTFLLELGHLPMSEHPERFRTYLTPVLDEIRRAGGP